MIHDVILINLLAFVDRAVAKPLATSLSGNLWNKLADQALKACNFQRADLDRTTLGKSCWSDSRHLAEDAVMATTTIRVGHAFVQSASAGATQVDSPETEVGACAICLDQLLEDVDTLPCSHQFHGRCKAELLAWGHWYCPVCRASLGERDIKTLINMLCMESKEVQAEAARALASLAEKSFQNQDVIREDGGIQALLRVLREGSQQAQTHAADALWCLAQNAKNLDVMCQGGSIQALLRVLTEGCREAQAGTAAVLQHLAENSPQRDMIIQAIIKVLQDGGQEAQARAARVLRSLAESGQYGNHVLIRERGIQALNEVLRKGSHAGRAEAAAVLRNLAVNMQNHDMMRDGGVI